MTIDIAGRLAQLGLTLPRGTIAARCIRRRGDLQRYRLCQRAGQPYRRRDHHRAG